MGLGFCHPVNYEAELFLRIKVGKWAEVNCQVYLLTIVSEYSSLTNFFFMKLVRLLGTYFKLFQ
jgi:hypothetical protein